MSQVRTTPINTLTVSTLQELMERVVMGRLTQFCVIKNGDKWELSYPMAVVNSTKSV